MNDYQLVVFINILLHVLIISVGLAIYHELVVITSTRLISATV